MPAPATIVGRIDRWPALQGVMAPGLSLGSCWLRKNAPLQNFPAKAGLFPFGGNFESRGNEFVEFLEVFLGRRDPAQQFRSALRIFFATRRPPPMI